MVSIAPDFPIENSSRKPRDIEQDLLFPLFLFRFFSFPYSSSSFKVFLEYYFLGKIKVRIDSCF